MYEMKKVGRKADLPKNIHDPSYRLRSSGETAKGGADRRAVLP